jgi:SRSO17 transposase
MRGLLVRRSISDPADRASYMTFVPDRTEFKELAAACELRWTIEECFRAAKAETGLDHWSIWQRHHQAKAKSARYRKRDAKWQL